MGNVYFEQGKYPSAIKNYRMALDALPTSAAYQRSRLMTNIGLAFVQLGQYADAASTFESALDMAPDHQVGLPASRRYFDPAQDANPFCSRRGAAPCTRLRSSCSGSISHWPLI